MSNTETKAEMFGTVIRNQRLDKQLSQGELGQQIYSGPNYNSQVWMSEIERGVKFPNDEELIRFSEVLSLPLDWLENLRAISQKERMAKIAIARRKGAKKAAKAKLSHTAKDVEKRAQALCKKNNILWENVKLPTEPLPVRSRTHYSSDEEKLMLSFLAKGFSFNEIAKTLGRSLPALKSYLAPKLSGRRPWNFEIEKSNKTQSPVKQLQMNYNTPSAQNGSSPNSSSVAKLCPVCEGHGVLATGIACYVPACGGKGVIL